MGHPLAQPGHSESPMAHQNQSCKLIPPAIGWLILLGVCSSRLFAQDSAPGGYYYCVERLSDGFVARRGTTSDAGIPQNGLILGPETRYRFWMLQAATGLSGYVDFVTPSSGFTFTIPNISLTRSRAPDMDRDGLAEDAEFVAGTDPTKEDTDQDGLGDFVEMRQGLDPLDGLTVRTGVLGTTDTPGDARDVWTLNDMALVADGAEGLSMFNVFQRMPPVLVGRLAVPGTALRVSSFGGFGVVAAGDGGLMIADISRPPDLRVLHRIPLSGSVEAVTADGGLAFGGTDRGEFAVVDLEGGGVLFRQTLDSGVQDLVSHGDLVHVLTEARLWTWAQDGGRWAVTGQVGYPGLGAGLGRRFRLSIGPGLLYATDTRGVVVFDTSDPRQPTLRLRQDTTQNGWKQLVSTGAGVGLGVVGPTGADAASDDLSVFDLGTDGTRLDLITLHPTPGVAHAVSIYNGLGYVADGAAGLQVVNYLAYDQGRQAPTVQLLTGLNPDRPVVEENKYFHLSARVRDDVQVRNVEFFLDGVRQVIDGNQPFATKLRAPGLSGGRTNFTVRARASDTGGNATESALITVQLVPDATPPAVTGTFPADGRVVGSIDTLLVSFSEPLDPATVEGGSLRLVGAGDDGLLGTADDHEEAGTVEYREAQAAVALRFGSALLPGPWELTVAPTVTDVRGNRLVAAATSRFWVLGMDDGDQDGVPDALELEFGYDPSNPDTDGDGLVDGEEDADLDELPNAWELAFQLNPRLADSDDNGVPDALDDPDGDTLTTGQERLLGTSPILADTDRDGWNDESEITAGSLPLDPASRPATWLVSSPALAVSVSGVGPGSGFVAGAAVSRPPLEVHVGGWEGAGGTEGTTLASPPVAVSVTGWGDAESAEAGPGAWVAAPPLRVVVSGWVAPATASTLLAAPPVAVSVPGP